MSWTYNFKDHTADIAVDIEADSLNELFTAAAFTWRESISDDKNDGSFENKSLTFHDESLEILLVAFLSELNFLFQSEHWMMSSVQQIDIQKEKNDWNLSIMINGGHFDRNQMQLKSEIKAITYHQMEIKEKNGKFSTRIVFDI
jgi:SHS2 domain-containing protein